MLLNRIWTAYTDFHIPKADAQAETDLKLAKLDLYNAENDVEAATLRRAMLRARVKRLTKYLAQERGEAPVSKIYNIKRK